MSIYFEKARELGRLVLSSEYSLRLSDASAALKADPAARAKIAEYQAYQSTVSDHMRKGAVSESEMPRINARLAEMLSELKRDPVVGGYLSAENDYHQFVSQVMSIFNATLSGSAEEDDGIGCGSVRHCPGCH